MSSTNYKSTVNYKCNPGYYSDLKTITCMANGQWSGSAPSCNGKLLTIRLSIYSGMIVKVAGTISLQSLKVNV